MEEELIKLVSHFDKILEKHSLNTKIILDRLYNTEYMTYKNNMINVEYQLSKDLEKVTECYDLSSLSGALIPIVKIDKGTITFVKTICAINEKNTNMKESMIYYLLKAISTDIKFTKAYYKKRKIHSGFVDILYEDKKNKIKCTEIDEYEYINEGVLCYLTEEMYKEIYKEAVKVKKLDNKYKVLDKNYLAKEITRILNFVVYEKESYEEILSEYLKNDIEKFLMNIQLQTSLEKAEVLEIYKIANLFLEGKTVCKSIYTKESYMVDTLKDFINNMYNIAKEKNIEKTEHFFAKELNKEIFSNIF